MTASIKLFLAVINLVLVFWMAWSKADHEKKQKVKDLKKEADDAVKNKDIPRLHALIESIGRL